MAPTSHLKKVDLTLYGKEIAETLYSVSYNTRTDHLDLKKDGEDFWSADECKIPDPEIVIEERSLDEEILEGSPISGHIIIRMNRANLVYPGETDDECAVQLFIMRMVEGGEVDAVYREHRSNTEEGGVENRVVYNGGEWYIRRKLSDAVRSVTIVSGSQDCKGEVTYVAGLYMENAKPLLSFTMNGKELFSIVDPESELSEEEINHEIREGFDLDTKEGRIAARLNYAYKEADFNGDASLMHFFDEIISRLIQGLDLSSRYQIDGYNVKVSDSRTNANLPSTGSEMAEFDFSSFITRL